jgi:hypothetical protein
MTPVMRAKLSRNIDYHTAMRDHYKEEDKKAKGAHEAEPLAARAVSHQRGTAEAAPPKPAQSAAEKLAELHDDVVQQLTAVLNAEPLANALAQVQAQPRPLRNQGANLKPKAGVFH